MKVRMIMKNIKRSTLRPRGVLPLTSLLYRPNNLASEEFESTEEDFMLYEAKSY